MSEQYELLSKELPSGFGPNRWVADETIPVRILKKVPRPESRQSKM
jgi:hypothetical protein